MNRSGSQILYSEKNHYSGNKPVLCSVSDCLRIASVSGDETVSVMNGSWHSFCVKVLDRAVEFTVDNITRTGYGDYNTSGDFAFVSGGMKVYLDDITYTRLALPSGVPEKIAPSNKTIQLCKYGKYAIEEINGIKAINSDGTYRYVSDYNTLSRRIVSGMKYAEISGGVISFSKDAPENCLVRIEAKYAGKTCTYDIRLTDSGMTQAEYIKSTVDRRRGDFALLQAIRCYYQLRGKVRAEQKAFDEIKNYLNQVSYPAKNVALSENHRLVFDVCEQLGAEITGRSTDAEEHLIAYFTEKLNNGFMEVQSPHYMVVDLYALETLWQFTENARLKQAAFDMAALIYGMQLTDSADGMIAGACVREYAAFGKTMTYLPSALMFGEGDIIDENYPVRNLQLSGIVFSGYMPPDILFDIAANREYPYEYQTKSRVYSFPFDENITETSVRYSYITNRYAMGSRVYMDDLSPYKNSDGTYSQIIAGMQEIPWSLSVFGMPDSLILESHPGNSTYHGQFAGDMNCLCGKYFQDKNVTIGMHRITKKNEAQYTHMLIPKNVYDSFLEQDGWIFMEKKRCIFFNSSAKGWKNRYGVFMEW